MPSVSSPLPIKRGSCRYATGQARAQGANGQLPSAPTWCRTPEQRLYEGIRPAVLFGIPPAERAQETGLTERSLGHIESTSTCTRPSSPLESSVLIHMFSGTAL